MQYHRNNDGSSSSEKSAEELSTSLEDALSISGLDYKVLVIDDHEPLVGVLTEVLSGTGFHVFSALNAEDALQFLDHQPPDIIICDVMMPGIDGFTLYDKVKQNPEWCNIPFVFLSALSEPSEIRFGKALGCDDYLTKPFDPVDLLATLKGKLSTFKKREELIAKRVEQYRRRIIHTLSHEFRTPLVAINTGTELLLEQFDSMDKVRIFRLLESIQRGGLRLQRLTDDFMTLQQIDSGAALNTCNKMKRSTSLFRVAEAALESFKEAGHYNTDSIRLDLPTPEQLGDYYAEIYDVQIVDVLKRLLGNACKFAGNFGGIEIRFGRDRQNAFVSVRDRGTGLPPEIMQRACELFTQIDRDRLEQQGCGLGLTIAHYYSGINGGNLTFHTLPDRAGFEVRVNFPVSTPGR